MDDLLSEAFLRRAQLIIGLLKLAHQAQLLRVLFDEPLKLGVIVLNAFQIVNGLFGLEFRLLFLRPKLPDDVSLP